MGKPTDFHTGAGGWTGKWAAASASRPAFHFRPIPEAPCGIPGADIRGHAVRIRCPRWLWLTVSPSFFLKENRAKIMDQGELRNAQSNSCAFYGDVKISAIPALITLTWSWCQQGREAHQTLQPQPSNRHDHSRGP